MKGFILAALPWIITGLCVAVLVVHTKQNRSKGKDGEKKESFMVEGMCVGMCVGMCCEANLGFTPGTGMCVGMLVGEVIGMMIPKEKKEK